MQQQAKTALPATLKVKVLRAFTDHRRQILKPAAPGKDEVHELPRVFALEMKAANKVAIVDDAAPTPTPVKEEQSTSRPVNGRKEK